MRPSDLADAEEIKKRWKDVSFLALLNLNFSININFAIGLLDLEDSYHVFFFILWLLIGSLFKFIRKFHQ